MQIAYQDLGHRSRGEIVEVTLSGNAANVRLMDASNFRNFRSGRQYRFTGGHAKRSPVRLAIPHVGHWYVTLDFGGYKGSARWGARILPGALPPLKEAPLSSVPSLVREPSHESGPIPDADKGKIFDVFISHASEDKTEVVRPLAHALQNEGLVVWYDEFELRIGDSLRHKIDRGLISSRTGVVVLSNDFFRKGWTNYELDGLVTKSISDDQVLLPIWHNITKKDLIGYSPSLADKVARSTGTHTVEEIAAEIAELLRSPH